jgi:hypothetical protein
MWKRTRRLFRRLVLVAMAVSSLAVGLIMVYVSKSDRGYVSFSTGHFVIDDQEPTDRLGFHFDFIRPVGLVSVEKDQRCCLSMWYSVAQESPPITWEKSAGPFEITVFSQKAVGTGVWWQSLERSDGTRNLRITLRTPTYLLLPILAGPPLWALLRGPVRRSRRRAKGLCETCAYNLTGNVTGICPECGTPNPLSPPLVRGEVSSRSAGSSCSPDR